MTLRSHNKSAARTLATLTGHPYQSCLGAIEVLRGVPSDFDIGELADFFTDRPIDTSLVSFDRDDLLELPDRWGPHVANWLTAHDPIYVHADEDDDEETSLAMRLSGHALELWPTVELWLELALDGPHVRRGTWRIPHDALAKALRAAKQAGSLQPANDDALQRYERVDVRVVRTRDPLFEFPAMKPDSYFTDGIADAIRSIEPIGREPGPGFDWLRFPYRELGLWEPPEEDHRLVECAGWGCGHLHDWPTADPRRKELVVPEPLLTAWRALTADATGPLENQLNSYRRDQRTFDGVEASLYGLDLPNYTTLWLVAEIHDPAVAAPALPD